MNDKKVNDEEINSKSDSSEENNLAEETAENAKQKTSILDSAREAVSRLETAAAVFISENNIMARFIGIFLIFSSIVFIINYNKSDSVRPLGDKWADYSNTVSFIVMALCIVIPFFGVTILKNLIPKLKDINADSYILAAGIMLFGICTLWRIEEDQYYLGIGMVLVAIVLFMCFSKYDDFKELEKIPRSFYISLMICLAVFVMFFIASTTIYKHKSFGTAVFDMGIFVQMYHSMISDFSLVTTCEREGFVSHFAVHFSPIFYTLYPVYLIFPKPETLLAAQAVLVVSGFIPVYLICRKYNFSDLLSFLFSMVYIFSTSIIAPCSYDFHENAFLPPLLMWFFYAIEKNNIPLIYIMAVLVLMVKEDAAFYVMCAGLYMIFSGKNKRHGAVVFLMTVAVFVNVLNFLASFGEGAMTYRTFGNLMQSYDGGFGDVIKTALSDPMHFISECFNEDKIKFILLMLLPLLFMPFITKKPSRLLLVVPFLITNLASGYVYASKFNYQYVFGTTACLIYAALLNTADLDKKNMKRVISLMAVSSVLMFTANNTRELYYTHLYMNNKEAFDKKEAILQAIPEDASVLTTAMQISHVANRKEVYLIDKNNAEEVDACDFVALDVGSVDEWKQKKIDSLKKEGYTVFAHADNFIIVLVSPDYEFKK